MEVPNLWVLLHSAGIEGGESWDDSPSTLRSGRRCFTISVALVTFSTWAAQQESEA